MLNTQLNVMALMSCVINKEKEEEEKNKEHVCCYLAWGFYWMLKWKSDVGPFCN